MYLADTTCLVQVVACGIVYDWVAVLTAFRYLYRFTIPNFRLLGRSFVVRRMEDIRRPATVFRWVANDYDVCHKHFINIALIFVATICYWSIMWSGSREFRRGGRCTARNCKNLRKEWDITYTVHCDGYITIGTLRIHCNRYTKGTLRRVHCEGYTAKGTLRRLHCKGYTAKGILRKVHWNRYTAMGTMRRVHCNRCTIIFKIISLKNRNLSRNSFIFLYHFSPSALDTFCQPGTAVLAMRIPYKLLITKHLRL